MFGRQKGIDVDQLKETLKVDEGVVYEIYNDHLGYPTFGIGHLVLEGDPEHGAAVGTPVSEDRVDECFEKDVESVISDCKKLHEGWDGYPEEVKQIIANMMFNMGLTRLISSKTTTQHYLQVTGKKQQLKAETVSGTDKLQIELKDSCQGSKIYK